MKLLQYKPNRNDEIDLIYNSIPEATRHLYGNSKEEVVTNYLKELNDVC